MGYSVESFQRAASLVTKWGLTPLNDGRTLSQALTIGGVPWWEVFAPTLATFYVPRCMAEVGRAPGLLSLARRRAAQLKKRLGFGDARPLHRFPATWPDGQTCLVLGFSEYIYRDVLRPVVERLRSSGGLGPVRLPCDPKRGATRPSFDSIHREQHVLGRNTTSALQELRRSGAWSLVLRNEDGTFNQCVWTQIRRLLLFELPDLLEHAAIARDLFRHNRVAIVLSGDVNDARSRVYCLSAKQFGVPSLEVQFGMYGSEAVEWQFFDADRVAVWGEHARLVMESHGIPADRIAVTGSPRHDVVSEWRKPTMRAALLKRFHCGDDTKVIVFAPSYSGLNDQVKFFNVVDAVCRAASVEERLLLIIKPHPGERSNEVARIASVYDRVRIGAAGDDVRDLIGGCDAFVTMGTTATMEALLAEVPVIWPNLDSLAWWEDTFMRSGAVITVTSEIELRRVFTAVAEGTIEERAAWSEQKRRLFVEAWTYAADGGASSRIANLAKSMAGTL